MHADESLPCLWHAKSLMAARVRETGPLLRIVGLLQPQSPADDELLRAIEMDGVIWIRGLVQAIVPTTIVTIGPAVVVAPTQGMTLTEVNQ